MTCACLIHGTASSRALAASVSKPSIMVSGPAPSAAVIAASVACDWPLDGDALDAEAGGDGELLDAAGQRVVSARGLAADDGAIDDERCRETARRATSHLPRSGRWPMRPSLMERRAAGDEAARVRRCTGRRPDGLRADGDAARQQGLSASPRFLAFPLRGLTDCTTHPPRSSAPARRTSGRYGQQARAQATSTSCQAGY